ncbi:MAG: CoA transferase [Dehalococcoidia bacterium]
MTQNAVAALAPYRVLDLTTEVGVLCPRFFAGLGADVIRIEPPGGHPTRQRAPFLEHDGPRTSLYWLQMNAGKRSVTLDLTQPHDRDTFLRLCETADVLVESYPPGYLAELSLGYDAVHARAPQLIYTSITPFGQDGPKANWRASDLVGVAAGGLMSLCGDPDRAPLRPTVEQAYAQAGLQAAVGAMIALHARHLSGRGQHADISMQAAVANALGNARLYYAMEGMVTRRAGGGRAYGSRGTRMIYPSSDGYIAFLRLPDTFPALAQWMRDEGANYSFDPDEWSGRSLVGPRMATPEESAALDRDFEPFFAAHGATHLYEEGQRRGLLICPVSTMRSLAENPQLEARDYFVDVWHDELGRSLRYPGAPFKMSATPWRTEPRAPLPGEHTDQILLNSRPPVTAPAPMSDNAPASDATDPARQIFAGLRIADFSWVGVGPNATQQFAWHGADVIRVESTRKPDTFRWNGPTAPNAQGLDRSAYWANYNRDKRGIQLNLQSPRAIEVAKRLVAASDIVTESFTPGFVRKIGLDYESLRKVKPDLIMISMSMEGQGGPHEQFRGFGLILQATAGITGLTGWPDRAPVGTGVAYTDWFATHCAAFALLAALDHRRRTGEGQYIDLSQLESTMYALDASVLNYFSTGEEAQRLGNRHPEAAPHGVFPCLGDDRWCAIAVMDDDHWHGLCAAMNRDDWRADPTLAHAAGRLQRQEELETTIAAWTETQSAEALQDRLQTRGVPAHLVATTADVEHDPQLQHRGHLWRTDHPVIGPLTYDGPAYRLSETPTGPRNPAPLLGEHNEEVYRGLLGYSEEEFADLLADGVIE